MTSTFLLIHDEALHPASRSPALPLLLLSARPRNANHCKTPRNFVEISLLGACGIYNGQRMRHFFI
jgi:hypothetical protein